MRIGDNKFILTLSNADYLQNGNKIYTSYSDGHFACRVLKVEGATVTARLWKWHDYLAVWGWNFYIWIKGEKNGSV